MTLPDHIAHFLRNKPQAAIDLFAHFYECYFSFAPQEVEATKTTLAFGTKKRYCYVYQFGKTFISCSLKLNELHEAPAIFFKCGQLSKDSFVHHFRLYEKKDVTPELKKYMKMALERSQTD